MRANSTRCLSLRLLITVLALADASSVVADQKSIVEDDSDDPVALAISKCRVKLQDKPSDVPYAFPKTQYRLALLLESKLTTTPKDAAVVEVAQLYAASAQNETHGFEPSVRVEALTKGATLMLQIGGEESNLVAEDMLETALGISGEDVDEANPQLLRSAHAAASENLLQLLLERASGDGEDAQLKRMLRVCSRCVELAPDEPVCDEYRGIALRRMHKTRKGQTFKSSILSPGGFGATTKDDSEAQLPSSAAEDVHKAYDTAAKKSHEAAVVASLTEEAVGMSRYPCGTLRFKYAGKKFPTSMQLKTPTENDSTLISSLWTRLVRHIILAAAAAREAGQRAEEDKHIAYGVLLASHPIVSEYVRPDVRADLFSNAGIRHKVRGETKEAVRYFRAAVEANPDDGHALVQLASLGDRDAAGVSELSDDYVSSLFDGYSERFEKELVGDLGYRGHEIVADGIVRHWVRSDSDGDVVAVDLGCGTGLLGELLRKRIGSQGDGTCAAAHGTGNFIIQGIDLSERMVELSRARVISDAAGNSMSVYDSVQNADASAFLRSMDSATVDIITASDVFIYVGALDEVFRESTRVLKEGGLLGFTVEIPPRRAAGGKDGLLLLKSGRFGHSKAYVHKLAKTAGLAVVQWKEEVLRKQGKDDVNGAVVLLKVV